MSTPFSAHPLDDAPTSVVDAFHAFELADKTEKAAKKMRESARKTILDFVCDHDLDDLNELTMDGITVNISRPTHNEPPRFDVNRTDEFFEALFEGGFADIAEATFKSYRQFDEASWFELVKTQDDNRRMRLHFLLEKFIVPAKHESMPPRVSLA